MKQMGITDSEKKLLFVVLALALLAGSYFFGFKKLNEAAAVIEASNQRDEAFKNELESMVERQPQTIQETEGFKQTIKDIVAKYPADIPQEKVIYLIQQSEETVGVDHASIGFSMDNLMMTFTGAEVNPVGYYASISLPYTATYEQIKTLLEYTADLDDRTTVPTVNISFDTATGNLNGNINYRMYYLRNTDREYEQLPNLDIPSGTLDIFHSEEMYQKALEERNE